MIRKAFEYQRTEFFIGFISICILMSIYQGLSWRQRQKNPNDTTMPSLVQIFKDGVKKVTTPDPMQHIWLLEDAKASGKRLAYGLCAGVFLAFMIGVHMGCYAFVEAVFRWPILFLGQLPPTAMLAVYLVTCMITGWPLSPMMVCFGILSPLALTIYHAVKYDIHDETIDKAYTLGAADIEIIWNVIVPQIMPRVIDAVRLVIGPAVVYLIAAEWINEHVGFGYRLKIQQRQTNMDVVYIYLIILMCFGFLTNWTLIQLRNFISPWYATGK